MKEKRQRIEIELAAFKDILLTRIARKHSEVMAERMRGRGTSWRAMGEEKRIQALSLRVDDCNFVSLTALSSCLCGVTFRPRDDGKGVIATVKQRWQRKLILAAWGRINKSAAAILGRGREVVITAAGLQGAESLSGRSITLRREDYKGGD